MLNLIKYFLITMGLLFVSLLFGMWYVWHTNLWNVRMVTPLLVPSDQTIAATTTPTPLQVSEYWIEQVDDETRACFVTLFGEERVQEIEAGASPTVSELADGVTCIN